MDTIREETPNITLERLNENFRYVSKTYTQISSATSGKGWMRNIYDKLRKRSNRHYPAVLLGENLAYIRGVSDALREVAELINPKQDKAWYITVSYWEKKDDSDI